MSVVKSVSVSVTLADFFLGMNFVAAMFVKSI